ncbi:hypothetical protein BH11ACT3_BH11ACT3_05800 [soil metagenome]
MTVDFQPLIQGRRYREIAIALLELEHERGQFDFVELAEHTESALEGNPELQIEYDVAPRRGCSVFGYYRYQTPPPSMIVVHPSMTSTRDRFTILHEFGHHVQRQHLAWANLRYSIPDPAGRNLEEHVADSIAAEILLPAELTVTGFTAADLSELHSRSRASRTAVAMRAVETAPQSESFVVMVLEADGSVLFGRAAGDDIFAPAKGVPQPDLKSLVEAAAPSGRSAGPLPEGIRAASGWTQGELVAEVAADQSGMYFFAVLRPAQKYGRVPDWAVEEVECPNPACEFVFSVNGDTERCSVCGGSKCPNCSSCYCEKALGDMCLNCFTALSLAEQSGQVVHECL